MRVVHPLMLAVLGWIFCTPCSASDAMIEQVLRAQVFDNAFEGFDYYHVTIEADDPQPDGSREVTAVASGKFLDRIQRVKALFLIVDGQIVGGQVLETNGLPPCLPQVSGSASSL